MISASAWAATVAAILGLLTLELVVDRRRRGPVSMRAAAAWSVVYLAVALGAATVASLVRTLPDRMRSPGPARDTARDEGKGPLRAHAG